MGEVTGISWCNHTFNPWIGCTKVSPACDGCYAEVSTPSRVHGVLWGNHPRRRTSPSTWAQPLAWNRKAERQGTRPFVFCASLADVFDNQVPAEWRGDLFDLIRATPNLTWLLLTKRPSMIAKLFVETLTPERRKAWGSGVGLGESLWPRNAAIGCTVVTQEEADRDVPALLLAKGGLKPAFAFLSMEPLLGPVDLHKIMLRRDGGLPNAMSTRLGDYILPLIGAFTDSPTLDWIITGGETDQGAHKARPTHPDWLRSIRDQCVVAGVPYHHKQNGEWMLGQVDPVDRPGWLNVRGEWGVTCVGPTTPDFEHYEQGFAHVGKKRSGRLLDGVLHDAMPAVRA